MSDALNTLDFKLLISCWLKRCKAPTTLAKYWRVIMWGLATLCDGYFPEADWDGIPYAPGTDEFGRKGFPLAGNMFCVLWNVKCDSEWSQNSLRLEGASCLLMCPWCQATATDDAEHEELLMMDIEHAPWNDLGDDATWRRIEKIMVYHYLNKEWCTIINGSTYY